MKITRNKIALIVALLLPIAACDSGTRQSDNVEDKDSVQSEQENSKVLVTVNGETISQADVDFMISRTFSGSEALFLDEKMQAKVLDSLIASKAMRQSMLKALPEEDRVQIQQRAKAYEEELYVKEYLVQNATPEPVTSAMVQNYYAQYPEEFGGGEKKTIEMLRTNRKPKESDRTRFLSSIVDFKENKSWNGLVENRADLEYVRSSMQPGLLDSKLESAVKNMSKGQVSDAVLIDGVPHIIRVIEVEKLPAKPLASVSASIRKKLAAIQLKKSVKKASEEVRAQSVVEFK